MLTLADAKTCPACHTNYPAEVEICPLDGALLQEVGEWLPGKVIRDKYVIFRRIGQDDVSVVYKARALEFDELRAITSLRPALARERAAVKEFRRVANLLATLTAGGIAQVETSGEAEDGRPFMVSELAEGLTLADLMRSAGALDPRRACSIARQTAAALEAAHRVGLLHLDLQPRNIILAGAPEDEHVKLRGFGTAYVLARRARRLQPPGARITLRDLAPPNPSYCSPEQALGTPVESLDARSDLYALGVILYEMLAGRSPFPTPSDGEDGEQLASLAARLESGPLPLAGSANGYEMPPALISLVVQLLERRRELRPFAAKAVAERIHLAEGALTSRAGLSAVGEESAPASAFALAEPEPEIALAYSVAAPEAAVQAPLEEMEVAPASVVGEPSRPSATSVLFKTEPPPRVSRVRWILAGALLLALTVPVWFFVTRGRVGNPGPLSPLSAEDVHNAITPAAASPVAAAPAASKAPGAGQASSSSAPASPQAGKRPAGENAAGEATPPSSKSATSVVSSSAAAPAPVPAQPARPKPSADELAAGIKRATAAGDLLFELGEYDQAIKAYQGPLKLDPGNKLLLGKIARAKRAQAAEQVYLRQ